MRCLTSVDGAPRFRETEKQFFSYREWSQSDLSRTTKYDFYQYRFKYYIWAIKFYCFLFVPRATFVIVSSDS